MVGRVSRQDRGFALILAIGALALIAAAVLLVAEHLQVRVEQFRVEERHVTLTALSDAGLAHALARLSADPQFAGLPTRPMGAGTTASRVSATSPSERHVEAVATYGQWQCRLEATVALEPEGPRVVRWTRRVTGGA